MSPTPSLPPDVPIIGQPKIDEIQVIVAFRLTCSCGHAGNYLGPVGGQMLCECHRVYAITGLPEAGANGTVRIPLGIGVAR